MKNINEFKFKTETVITPKDIYGYDFARQVLPILGNNLEIVDFRIPIENEKYIAINTYGNILADPQTCFISSVFDEPRFIVKQKELRLQDVLNKENVGKFFDLFHNDGTLRHKIMIAFKPDGSATFFPTVVKGKQKGYFLSYSRDSVVKLSENQE